MGKCMEHMGKMGKEGGKNDGKGLIWFPLAPIVIGLILFALGWYVNPEVTRVLWIIASGLIISMGAMMWIMGTLMFRAWKKKEVLQA